MVVPHSHFKGSLPKVRRIAVRHWLKLWTIRCFSGMCRIGSWINSMTGMKISVIFVNPGSSDFSFHFIEQSGKEPHPSRLTGRGVEML